MKKQNNQDIDFESEEYEIAITKEAEEIVKETFPKLWNDFKERMKDYSKKEVAERMYLFGILTHIRLMDIGTSEVKKEMEKDPEIKRMLETIADGMKDMENK